MLTPPVTPAGRADARPANFLPRGSEPHRSVRMTPNYPSHPTVRVNPGADLNPVEYALLFLVIVAGALTYLR